MRLDSQPTGGQIAFLSFAFILLMVPPTLYITRSLPWSEFEKGVIKTLMPFTGFALAWVCIPPLARTLRRLLAVAIPRDRWREVACIVALKMAYGFAIAGGLYAWHGTFGDPARLEGWVREFAAHEAQMARQLSVLGVANQLLITSFAGPVMEELFFRGLLYRAVERRWGWVAAALGSAALFGVYHANFWQAFFSGVLYACLVRRTGSVWSAIAVHMTYNFVVWYPLLGRHLMPPPELAFRGPGEWWIQLAALAAMAIALPAYLAMARNPWVARGR